MSEAADRLRKKGYTPEDVEKIIALSRKIQENQEKDSHQLHTEDLVDIGRDMGLKSEIIREAINEENHGQKNGISGWLIVLILTLCVGLSSYILLTATVSAPPSPQKRALMTHPYDKMPAPPGYLRHHSGALIPIHEFLSRGLVAHYPLDGQANDLSEHANHGQVYGANPTIDRFGREASAYSFNGNDQYIRIPDHPAQRSSEELTIALWIKNIAGADYQSPLSKGNVRKYNFHFEVRPDTGKLSFSVLNGLGASHAHATSTTRVDDQKWHFITATVKKNDEVRIYVDAKLEQSNQPRRYKWRHELNADLCIGRRGDGIRYFKGSVDDVYIFNYVMSHGDISLLFEYLKRN